MIRSAVAGEGRWIIALTRSGKTMSIKSQNMAPIPTGGSHGARAELKAREKAERHMLEKRRKVEVHSVMQQKGLREGSVVAMTELGEAGNAVVTMLSSDMVATTTEARYAQCSA